MAEPKKVTKSFTNTGAGPRSLILATNETLIVRPGESTGEREFREADLKGLSPDLVEGGAEDAGAGTGTDASTRSSGVDLDADLDTLDRNQLLALGLEMGLTMLGDNASDDDIREAIQLARDNANGASLAEIQKLMSDNTRDELLQIAADEKVQVESDDNKTDLATKIAQARAAKQ